MRMRTDRPAAGVGLDVVAVALSIGVVLVRLQGVLHSHVAAATMPHQRRQRHLAALPSLPHLDRVLHYTSSPRPARLQAALSGTHLARQRASMREEAHHGRITHHLSRPVRPSPPSAPAPPSPGNRSPTAPAPSREARLACTQHQAPTGAQEHLSTAARAASACAAPRSQAAQLVAEVHSCQGSHLVGDAEGCPAGRARSAGCPCPQPAEAGSHA